MEPIALVKDAASCCGCGACLFVCPKQAITMKADPYGCLYPQIDSSKCIHCGKCVQICQYNKAETGKIPALVYAAVGQCSEKVKRSASGGVFAALAESCVHRGGLAAGVVMDLKNSRAEVYHLLSAADADLSRMQGSKYVHSEAWRCYPPIVKALREGKTVLFSGTPCQVAAVKALTGDPDNLVTVDLICHGVPPLQMMNDYLQILSSRFHGEITGFRFRDKSGVKQFTAGIDVCRGQRTKHIFLKSTYISFYKYFLNSSIYRENCYTCPYAGGRRVSDITIGDYWGIEAHHASDMESGRMIRRKDWSCLLVNTEKGEQFLSEHRESLFLYPSRLAWIVQQNQQLKEPAKRGKNRDQLLKRYRELGYGAVEAAFVQENGGRLRFCWRMIRNVYENNRTTGKKYEN